jgi:phage terminase small subunit
MKRAQAKQPKELTAKQKLFVAEYLVDLNATQAYIRAGYSPKAANECAARLLANASIQRLVSEKLQVRTEKLEITGERVLSELAHMGFANMLDYIRPTEDGAALVDLSQLTREQAKAIQELTVDSYVEGSGDAARQVKRVRFKLADKRGSLELLGKNLKLFTDKHEHDFNLDFASLTDNEAAAFGALWHKATVGGGPAPAQRQNHSVLPGNGALPS